MELIHAYVILFDFVSLCSPGIHTGSLSEAETLIESMHAIVPLLFESRIRVTREIKTTTQICGLRCSEITPGAALG